MGVVGVGVGGHFVFGRGVRDFWSVFGEGFEWKWKELQRECCRIMVGYCTYWNTEVRWGARTYEALHRSVTHLAPFFFGHNDAFYRGCRGSVSRRTEVQG